MTEADWLASTDPAAMLSHVSGQISPRRLRLFACACCRAVWEHLTGGSPRGNIGGTRRALVAFEEWVEAGDWTAPVLKFEEADDGAGMCVRSAVDVRPDRAAENAAFYARQFASAASQAALLREVVGNPFRPVEIRRTVVRCVACRRENPRTRLEHFWCAECNNGEVVVEHDAPAWLTPTVVAVARGVYDRSCPNRCCDPHPWNGCSACRGSGRRPDGTLDPDRLAVLSDALEEAGCDSEELLRHLRGEQPAFEEVRGGPGGQMLPMPKRWRRVGWKPLTGPHVRGCWALDLVLGKE